MREGKLPTAAFIFVPGKLKIVYNVSKEKFYY